MAIKDRKRINNKSEKMKFLRERYGLLPGERISIYIFDH